MRSCLPIARMRATIHLHDFSNYKTRSLEKQQSTHDFLHCSEPVTRMEILQRLVGFLVVHRGIYDSRANGIKPDASVRILNCKTLGGRSVAIITVITFIPTSCISGAEAQSFSVLLVCDLLHPLDNFTVELFLDCDVRHRRIWCRCTLTQSKQSFAHSL
jgi:hypothetical protein